MYKMLVVEDEKWEREGLRDFLDWNSLGIELSGLASDGIEGLEKARELSPDIIITDIKMPGMDGLKMSLKIKEFLPNVKIVILTGYDDFKLAREAINISANAYVLKPVEEEELLDVMAKVLAECNKDTRKIEEEKILKGLLDKNLTLTRQRLLSGLLSDKPGSEVIQQIELSNILPACKRYAVIAVKPKDMEATSLADIEGIPGFFEEDGKLKNPHLSLTFHSSEETLYAIAGGEESDMEGLGTSADHLLEGLLEKGIDAIAGVGTITEGIEELYISYRRSREAMDFSLFWGDRKITLYTELEAFQQEHAAKTGDFLMKGNYFTKQLMHSLRGADEPRMNELLAEMFQLIEVSRCIDRKMIMNFLYGLLNETSLLFYNANLSELDEGTAGSGLLSLPDYRSVKDCVTSFFQKATGIIKDKKNNKDEYVVKKVEQIVEERYNTDISIKTIAAEIYLSPNYLGSIFRKSTGKPFNDYLCEYRMEKAKELLQSPKYKVSRVAQEVGIPNVSYFCQLFKEVFGIAPGEYQEMVIRGNI